MAVVCACGKTESSAPVWPESKAFSGKLALEEAARFAQLGPRVSGTTGAEKAAAYLVDRLRGIGITAHVDAFEDATPMGTQTFRNVIGQLPGSLPETIVLVSHYDTKGGIADDFIGANDSGSSTGVLLELARVLRSKKGGPAIEFLFTDGEECKVAYGPTDGLHGSRRHSMELKRTGASARVKAVILLDMVGDRNLKINLPRNCTPELASAIFKAAEVEGVRSYFGLGNGDVLDDHAPFLQAGMPAADLIDFSYGEQGDNRYWHTREDTVDKLAAESMEIVGRVVLRLLPTL